MKLIIDIPKANYEKMKIMDEKSALENPYLMAIAQGTPLPKEQEPKTGHWIKDEITERLKVEYKHKCDLCGAYHRAMYDYCPSCGAKME